jgi:hypothetical protein
MGCVTANAEDQRALLDKLEQAASTAGVRTNPGASRVSMTGLPGLTVAWGITALQIRQLEDQTGLQFHAVDNEYAGLTVYFTHC